MSASEVERAREAVRRQMTSPHDSEDDARLAAFEAAVRAEEREAVAAMCDAHGRHTQAGQFCREADRMMRTCRCGDIAAAIRARGTA